MSVPGRPRARWFVLGATLVALGVVVLVVGLFWTLRGLFSIDGQVAADGRPHTLTVDSGDRFLWVDSSVVAPECTLADPDGTPLPLHRVGGSVTRDYGSAGPWEARWWFSPLSDTVVVTCDGVTRSAEVVEVGARLGVRTVLGGVLASVGLAVLLGGSGAVLLLVLTIRWLAGGTQTRLETT